MSIHLQRFVDRLRGFEARGAKDFVMSLTDAKDLHADITRLLVTLETLRNADNTTHDDKNQPITVQITGGSFK
jgi:hypothetical protein